MKHVTLHRKDFCLLKQFALIGCIWEVGQAMTAEGHGPRVTSIKLLRVQERINNIKPLRITR